MSNVSDWLGAVGAAIGGVGTAGALGYAAVTYARQVTDARRHQADRISAWVDGSPRLGWLLNSSESAVFEAKVIPVDPSDTQFKTADGLPLCYAARVLPPGKPRELFGLHSLNHLPSTTAGVYLTFRDASGRYWIRNPRGHLDETDDAGHRSWPPMLSA
jgi:hypothetical protein